MTIPHNHVARGRRSPFRGDVWRALDAMPRALRVRCWESVVDWDPYWVLSLYRSAMKKGLTASAATARVAAEVEASGQWEINRFSHHWPSRFGRYPHTAAGVSPLRYDEASRHRRPRPLAHPDTKREAKEI